MAEGEPGRPPLADLILTGDATLAALAAQGDRAAFGELVRRAMPGVRSVLRRMGAQPATADDVAQDAFLAAHRSVDSYRGEASFAAWTMRIAARLYVRRMRGEARFLTGEEGEHFATGSISEDPAAGMDLDRALALLSPAERLCVSLCHGAGFTQAEIAAELNMPLGTVKSHVLRGLDKLRQRLEVAS